MMNRNAIILAAGKSNRFAPFTYERPKGLFRVKGEILIERQIEQLQRELSPDEHRHWWAYIALCAFYWFGWGLYKGSVGDDDGFFFLPAYRNFHRFIDQALNSYE